MKSIIVGRVLLSAATGAMAFAAYRAMKSMNTVEESMKGHRQEVEKNKLIISYQGEIIEENKKNVTALDYHLYDLVTEVVEARTNVANLNTKLDQLSQVVIEALRRIRHLELDTNDGPLGTFVKTISERLAVCEEELQALAYKRTHPQPPLAMYS